jgi:phospholipid/cholesterol/gamma-HCH transport system ATP-binding protein
MSETNSNGQGRNAIEVRELCRSFGRQQVLNHLSLDVPQGQITTIVGPSGCGKTVLLKHLNMLLRPDSGTINVDGTDVTRLGNRAQDAVRENLGMLFQAGALFDSMTVYDNVAFPLVEKTSLREEEIRTRVHETLAAVGLEGMEGKYPSEMSGGMQKRAALARALVRRPRFLMLDEPTTGLDPTRTGAIHDLIRSTQRKFNLTAVMVSHDVPAVFQVSDRVAFLNHGKTHISGSVEEVMGSNDEVFKRFLAGRAAGDDDGVALGG